MSERPAAITRVLLIVVFQNVARTVDFRLKAEATTVTSHVARQHFRLAPHHLDAERARARTVELRDEDALPLPEHELCRR